MKSEILNFKSPDIRIFGSPDQLANGSEKRNVESYPVIYKFTKLPCPPGTKFYVKLMK
jgi:hypothetical protein